MQGRLALLGDVEGAVVTALADAGLAVVGGLADDPLTLVARDVLGPHPRAYGELAEVVEAAGARALDAAVLPPRSPLAAGLPELLEAGLPVLLPEPAPWDPDVLRDARASRTAADVPVAVLLRERAAGWALAVRELVSAEDGPPVQVTVRGWPRGPVAAAELVDLLRAWCGDVVAVAAVPAPLPASSLPDGPRVVWALLVESGATVLVAHEGSGPSVRLSFPARRLLAGRDRVGWDDGPTRACEPGPDPVVRTCRAFARAVGEGTAERLGDALAEWPWVPDLADLLPPSRVLAALRRSARTERWVELG